MLLRRRLSRGLPQLLARRCLCATTPLARHGSQDAASTPRLGSRLAPAQRAELLDRTDTFLFDCDGVIWRGDAVIDGVPETLEMLRRKGKRLIFLTNNSTKSRAGYEAKFQELGIAVTAEEIFASSFAAATYLTSRSFSPEGKVYVVGEAGIQQELDLAGIQHLGGPDDASKRVDMGPGGVLEIDPAVKAVVVGLDREINYYKIQYATQCVRELGAELIATNRDAVAHLTSAQTWAGGGAIVAAIAAASQVGKPSTFMLSYICDTFGIAPREICMVGDRLDTDIAFGLAGGVSTLLVLSGVTTEEALLNEANSIMPDGYTDALPDLLDLGECNA